SERDEKDWKVDRFSLHYACDRCGRSFEPLNPHHFSFNSPLGWCPTCEGLGVQKGASQALIVRDSKRSLRDGALAAWPALSPTGSFTRFAEALARHLKLSLDAPFAELKAEQQAALLQGTGEDWISLAAPEPGQGDRKRVGTRFQYKGVFPAI